jgi:hypothetical protein
VGVLTLTTAEPNVQASTATAKPAAGRPRTARIHERSDPPTRSAVGARVGRGSGSPSDRASPPGEKGDKPVVAVVRATST